VTCIFCEIVAGRAPAEYVGTNEDCIAIIPLNPVTPGHAIVLPKIHVTDFADEPVITGKVFEFASYLADTPANLITSAGEVATQSVFHLHVHIVPRHFNDKLALPWHSGKHGKNGTDR